MWHEIKNLKHSDSEEISANIQVPPNSPWFNGHFPEEPILPGIAQLSIIFDAIRLSTSQNMRICGVRRIRFKQLIKPNDQLHIVITPQKDLPGSYAFRIMVAEELVTSGIIMVETRKSDGGKTSAGQVRLSE
ncbi:3-hydroxyacyl-ACP dehydratase FabZ family protein [Thermodesulfobacteriota bacterium]